MTYKIKYDGDSDVITIVVKEKGKLSHAQEVGDIILHVDDKGEPLFLEILRASKIVPLMIKGSAKKEVTVAYAISFLDSIHRRFFLDLWL